MVKILKDGLKKIFPWGDESSHIYALFRRAHKHSLKGHRYRAMYFSHCIAKQYRCYIHCDAEIGDGIAFPHPVGIVIGAGAKVGKDVVIYQGVTLGRKYLNKADYPIIGDGVIIYANTVVAGKVTIGKNAIIGCNSVVLRNVSDGEVVSGVVK